MGRTIGPLTAWQQKEKCLSFLCNGGGWTHGCKNNEYDKIKVFIKNVYAVANVGYRVAKEAVALAAVEDVQS